MSRTRPDACPGAWRRHDAADGALARFRPVGGATTAAELRLLAGAAATGGSPLELTSRGSWQVRGLTGSAADDLADALAGLHPDGPPHRALLDDRGRDLPCSLVASPRAAPVDAVTARVAAGLRGRTDVPGRLLVAVEGPDEADVRGQAADVTVILGTGDPPAGADRATPTGSGEPCPPDTVDAARGRPRPGGPGHDPDRAALHRAALLLDGPRGLVDTGLRHDDPATLALAAVDAFVGRRGSAWRLRELPDDDRAALVADVRDRTGAVVGNPGAVVGNPSAVVGNQGAVVGDTGVVVGNPDPTRLGPADDGTLEVLPRLGEVTLPAAGALVALLEATGASLRATPWRTLVLRDLPDPEAAAARLAPHLETTADSPWRGLSACVGAPRCAKSITDVRGDLAAAVADGRVDGAGVSGGGRQHWVGCARACGTPGGRVTVVEAVETAGPGRPGEETRGTYRTIERSGKVIG